MKRLGVALRKSTASASQPVHIIVCRAGDVCMSEPSPNPIAGDRPPRRSIRRRLQRGFVTFGLVPYVAVTLIMSTFQRQMIYHPDPADDLSAGTLGLEDSGIRDVEIRTPDGNRLGGWLLERPGDAPRDQRPLLIFFSGNARHRYGRLATLREVADAGFDVLIFDYRGYGDSTGRPTEHRLSADARRVWHLATHELGYAADHTVIFGESLGGAVALSLWAGDARPHPRPAAVVLNSTFTSMPDTVSWHYPMFPFRLLVLDQWPSLHRIPSVDAPVTIFHGTDDDLVPYAHGQALADAHPRGTLITVPQGQHNRIPPPLLRDTLRRIREAIVSAAATTD